MASTVTPPDQPGFAASSPQQGAAANEGGARLHWQALEGLYASAPINGLFRSRLHIPGEGQARIVFDIDPAYHHAAGAAHGTVYFKMLDDAAFYAANTMVTDRFLLTTSFNLHFTHPVKAGRVVAEARLVDGDGEEIGRGTGTFMRSRIPLSGLEGYARSFRPAPEE